MEAMASASQAVSSQSRSLDMQASRISDMQAQLQGAFDDVGDIDAAIAEVHAQRDDSTTNAMGLTLCGCLTLTFAVGGGGERAESWPGSVAERHCCSGAAGTTCRATGSEAARPRAKVQFS